MPQNLIQPATLARVIVAKAALTTLLVLPILITFAGCSRKAETPAPAVITTDRAEPVPVAIPDLPDSSPAKASVQRKIPVEDTLEPVPIDNASVPSSKNSTTGPRDVK
jgi:hypothetical protein